jgi:hypothetical protein
MDKISILENIDNDYSDDLELDTSWIKKEEKLEHIQENYFREPMEFIDVFFIYINSNSYIEKIISEKHPLILLDDNKTTVLKKEYILQLIQSKKIKTAHSIYKLMDVLIYNIDIEPDFIQNYSKNDNIAENSKGFFKVLKIIDDILFSPSIFIFHDMNSIFFLFQEKEVDIKLLKPKSILKVNNDDTKGDNKGSHLKTTKKVKIIIGGVDKSSINNKKMTRKRFSRKYFEENF